MGWPGGFLIGRWAEGDGGAVIAIEDPGTQEHRADCACAQEQSLAAASNVATWRTCARRTALHFCARSRRRRSARLTRDLSRAHRVAARLRAGRVFVNEWFAGGIATPFGGVGKSGYGREKGLEALYTYVRTKNVAISLKG